jgi:hypothetical protein
MSKDETMIGITGLTIPKKKMSPAKQHEFEKKRRANLGTNVGGQRYSKDVTPGYNPRARTFEEFMSIAESVSASDVKLAQSGRISRNADALQREIDAVKGGKKPATPNRSARRVTRQDFVDRSNVKVRKEETAVADKPATAEEKRKIVLMQKLARLKAAAKGSRMVSDVAKEEYETEDYKPLERKTGAMIGRATKLGQKGGMAQLAQRRAENTPTGLRTLTGSRAKEEQMKRIKKDAYTKAAKIQVVAATHDPKEVQGKASLNRARGTKSNIRQFSRTTSEK